MNTKKYFEAIILKVEKLHSFLVTLLLWGNQAEAKTEGLHI